MKQCQALPVMIFMVLAFMTAGCGLGLKKDTIAQMTESLPLLLKDQPPLLWKIPLKSQDVDIMRFISRNRVLIGTIEMPAGWLGLFSHEFKDLVLCDTDTGRIIWTFPRKSLGGESQRVVSTGPLILLKGSDNNSAKYMALDPNTGAIAWERTLKTPEQSFLTPAGQIILISTEPSLLQLNVLRLEDGTELWKSTLEDYHFPKDAKFEIKQAGEDLFIIGQEILKIFAKNGEIAWKAPFPGTFGSASLSVVQREHIVLSDGTNLSRVNMKSGSVVFKTLVPDMTIKLIASDDKNILLLAKKKNGETMQDIVAAFDNTSGKIVWVATPGDSIHSYLMINEGVAYVTTNEKLIGLDLETGKIIFKSDMPRGLQAGKGLPDILIAEQQIVLVAREAGVAAFSTKDGRLLFSEEIDGGYSFTYDYLLNKYDETVNKFEKSSIKRKEMAVQSETAKSDVYYRMAVSNQEHVYQRTAPVLAAGSRASHSEKQTAIRDRMMATDKAYSAARMERSQNQMNAALEFSGAITGSARQLAAALDSGVVLESVARMRLAVMQSLNAHAESIQDKFYIRPFYLDGWRLAVVDLKSGNRANIVLSPANEPLRINGLNLPAYAINETGTKLIANGLGFDTSHYETYEKLELSEFSYPGFVSWILPYPSVLYFDLAGATFTKNKTRNGPSNTSSLTAFERAMITAALNNDCGAVENALVGGANINAVDEYGHTALMHAASVHDEKTVNLLLDKGADMSIKDPGGLRAWNYIFIPLVSKPGEYEKTVKHFLDRLKINVGEK